MRYVDQTFTNTTVSLDGNQFRQCRFGSGCTIVVSGASDPKLNGCQFDSGVEWRFTGAAGRTLDLLSKLSKRGGHEMVAEMLQQMVWR